MVDVASPRTVPDYSGSLLACRVTLVLLAFSPAWLSAADIYKTVDANGNVSYSDHADPSSQQTTLVELHDPRYPPHEMHVCWTNCFTLIYDGHLYRRADGTDETWTVEKFSADSFVLHRHSAPAQWNGFKTDVTYTGHTANDRLIGVALDGKPTSGIDASWGIALNTLPGSNAERDAMRATGSSDAGREPAVSVAVAPPPLLDDLQPDADQDGALWTPGYWQWDGTAYAWTPGVWAQPPGVGLLWTPAYWSFGNGRYVFHPGYWGRHVGFYGGINYGFGYFGTGYLGGHWVGKAFAYNSVVNHLKPGVLANVYAEAIPNLAARSRVSYNAGPGGTSALATAATSQSRTAMGSPISPPPARAVSSPEAPPEAAQNPPARSATQRNISPPSPRVSRPAPTKSPAQPR
jgi:hypothetical protein